MRFCIIELPVRLLIKVEVMQQNQGDGTQAQ